jgi:tRNA U54 and U55 pseudouridine synthase Pus10
MPDPMRVWMDSQKVQPAGWQGPTTNPCKTCPEVLEKIREIDSYGAALVEEYETLRKQVSSRGIQAPQNDEEAPQVGEEVVQQLQEIAERLIANAAERRVLVKHHDTELAEWWVSSQPRLQW